MSVKLKQPQNPQTFGELKPGDVFQFVGRSPFVKGTLMFLVERAYTAGVPRFVVLSNGHTYDLEDKPAPIKYLGRLEEQEEPEEVDEE